MQLRRFRLAGVRVSDRPEVKEERRRGIGVSAIGGAAKPCTGIFSVGEDYRAEPRREERECCVVVQHSFAAPLLTEADDGPECRDHLLPIAVVEPDHIPQIRAARLPEQACRYADAQQGDLRTTAPGDSVRNVSFGENSRIRICRECESV